MTQKIKNIWEFSKSNDLEKISEISKIFEIPISLAKILHSRGINSESDARKFFFPTKNDLHDPFLMKGMDIAVKRVLDAAEKKEKVLIYGDYDVDGTNGVAMLYLFLQQIGIPVAYFIPDRIKDGYGLSTTGINFAKELNVTLLISVDCGITGVEQVNYANENGIDVIICDHHEPGEILPNAIAILNPLQKDCNYPFKFLCGCGVAFKLVSAIIKYSNLEIDETNFLDFVALASTADVVPMIDENRTIVKLGLEKINNSPRPGIKSLLEKLNIKPSQLSSGQVVFQLAPRINAVGRLGDAIRAVKLLISNDLNEAREYASILEEENAERRKIDEDVLQTAISEAEKSILENKSEIFVLYNPTWHPGVIGIVASRIVEKYYRPTILLTEVDGLAKGSARSINGFSIHDALKQCSAHLSQFGGHKYAAGLSLPIENIEKLRDDLQKIGKELITDEISIPKILIDAQVELHDLDKKFLEFIKLLSPFGPGNLKPNFLLKNAPIYGFPKIVGKNHLKFKIKKNGSIIDCIGFGLGDHFQKLSLSNTNYEFIFSIDENDFAGYTLPQLKIRDLRVNSDLNEN